MELPVKISYHVFCFINFVRSVLGALGKCFIDQTRIESLKIFVQEYSQSNHVPPEPRSYQLRWNRQLKKRE